MALRSAECALAAERFAGERELAGKRGGERKKGENHFIGDTVKDLFEWAASLSVLPILAGKSALWRNNVLPHYCAPYIGRVWWVWIRRLHYITLITG